MTIAIDRFYRLGEVYIIQGWSSSYTGSSMPIMTAGGRDIETVSRPHRRMDLVPHHGAGSERWGFNAVGIPTNADATSTADIGLRFASGEAVSQVIAVNPQQIDADSARVWPEFVTHVNEKGGRLLEIGSRARSGNTRRDLFGSNVEYIGVDVTAGENVDIVADAHHLSDFIKTPVDFVVSISTFEHFLMPWKVALELNKICRTGARVFSQSHQSWPIHDAPYDYFRFSDQAWYGLFNVHTGFDVLKVQQGHPVAVSAYYNLGGPFEHMEYSPGYALSICVAEKSGEAIVSWDAPAAMVRTIEYNY